MYPPCPRRSTKFVPGSLSYRVGAKRPMWTHDANFYRHAVLTDQWYKTIEGYPKDYDYETAPVKNCALSTYNRWGYDPQWYLPKTTTDELQDEVLKTRPLRVVDHVCSYGQKSERDAGFLLEQLDRYGDALTAKHLPCCPALNINTTYRQDYIRPFPPKATRAGVENECWQRLVGEGAFKRGSSELYESDSYRHEGQDDGCEYYPNRQIKLVAMRHNL